MPIGHARPCCLLLVLLVACFPAAGIESGDGLRAVAAAPGADEDLIQTLSDAAVRSAPNAAAEVLFTVPAKTDLTWVVHDERDGFYRAIRRGKGPHGWIRSTDVVVTHEHAHATKVHACVAQLDACPAFGCAEKDSPEGRANELKRAKPPLGVPVTLSFDDFLQLQREADARVGQGPMDLTLSQEAALAAIPVGPGEVGQGSLVRVVAFIARGGEGLHANSSGESVNCMLKKDLDNDFHIPVVRSAGDSEYQGIVVEMIPQQRPAAWTIEALKKLQADGTKVWVEGGLSYDKVHFVNADPAHPIKDEPDRMSLWEIHPITKFLVCRKDSCDPNFEQDWSEL